MQPAIQLEADECGLLPDRYRSPKLRSFVDFMVERFG
jgi:hypothetical protein